ncbi:hypothetical protein GCM10007363_19910 [Pseudomonas fluvialis]|uniref:Uncharacterized protein n=1 Tax=Pseudomonas fluvialis TaxID=1793966 RepID=A0ABQ2AMA0_9PSED|nr:hypothetical protein GCM10007363_19910 [Pseudomonas fluvialis]
MLGVSPAGSSPVATRLDRACWIKWRMVSFMVCSVGRGWSKTAHYTSSGKRQAITDKEKRMTRRAGCLEKIKRVDVY